MADCKKCGHPTWAHSRGKCEAVNQRKIKEEYDVERQIYHTSYDILGDCDCVIETS